MAQGKAVVIGHSDGDGHLAVINSIENLTEDGFVITNTIVDPTITRNCKFWINQFPNLDFDNADLVVIVDIMFDRKNPELSINEIEKRAKQEPSRKFIIIDHHPLNIRKLKCKNVDIRIVDKVYDCCYGDPSDLMLVASICDKDELPVKSLITDIHRKRAYGISRAVTDKKGMAGKITLDLISNRVWNLFEALADEPKEYHKTFYGNRTQKITLSPILQAVHYSKGII